MKIVVFGLTITSAWGNGHATTYRSLLRALARRGHKIEFVEKQTVWYRDNRDLPEPEFCKVILYDDWKREARSLARCCSDADVVVIGSYFPDAIDAAERIFTMCHAPVFFYDIDTPITIAHLRRGEPCPYLDPAMIRQFDAYLSFTGGPLLRELEMRFGAQFAAPLYCSVDPDRHHPVPAQEQYRCELSYLGTYAQDRQPRLMALLNQAAELIADARFIVAGAMYPKGTPWARNVCRITHVSPPDHPAFYSSSRFSLNLTRAEMIAVGYSPSVRLFEASACGAAILSDNWPGLDEFLTPKEEVLLPRSVEQVVDILKHITDAERVRMGSRARERILAEHTSAHRAAEFEAIVSRCTSVAHIPSSAGRMSVAEISSAR